VIQVLTRKYCEGSIPSRPTNANTARHTFLTRTPPWMIGRAALARESRASLARAGSTCPARECSGSDSRGVSGFGNRTTGRFDSCIRYQCASRERPTKARHRGSVVQREDTRFAPEECRFESDRNPPVHLEIRPSRNVWIVHPAGLDTVSKTVGASPPGVRVPRYPPGLEWTTAREAAPIGNRLARQRVWVGSKSLRQSTPYGM
jgi:hypothetical protein